MQDMPTAEMGATLGFLVPMSCSGNKSLRISRCTSRVDNVASRRNEPAKRGNNTPEKKGSFARGTGYLLSILKDRYSAMAFQS